MNNRKNKLIQEQKQLDKVDKFAYRPKMNALEVDINNTMEHESAKFLCLWMIRKGVHPMLLPKFLENPGQYKLADFVRMYKSPAREGIDVMTEVRFKDHTRADLWIPSEDIKIEIETGKSYDKPISERTVVIRI